MTALTKSKSELGFNFNNIPKNPALKAGGLSGADCSLACWEPGRPQAAPSGPETWVLPLSQPCGPTGCLSPPLLATAPLSSGGAGPQSSEEIREDLKNHSKGFAFKDRTPD